MMVAYFSFSLIFIVNNLILNTYCDMKRKIIMRESDFHRLVNGEMLWEQTEITYNGDEQNEEWEMADICPEDITLVPDAEIAEFHSSNMGFTILFRGEEFGEAWEERDGLMLGNSDYDYFGGYTRGFEGYGTDGLIEDILDKLADALLNPEDEDEYDEEEEW